MNKNKIVLVLCSPSNDLNNKYSAGAMVPQTGEIPLGILYIAAELEKGGFEVAIIDNTILNLCDEDLAKNILSYNPIIIGFSLLVLNVVQSRNTAEIIKQTAPESVVVFGGPHATIMSQKYANFDFIDLVITHQGEITLRKIAEKVAKNEFVFHKDASRKIVMGEKVVDLDDLSFPARNLVDVSAYSRRSYVLGLDNVDYICSSRGCPFNCSFCSSITFWERKYYKRSAKNVVDEIEFLVSKYGSKGIYFREDNFTVDRKHVVEICREIIKRRIKIKWECESRVDTVDYETLKIMKKAGCEAIWCGVESGSQKILDSINKGYTLKDVDRFCKWCKKLNIKVGACFMIGFPDETPEDIRETYEFAVNLPVSWRYFVSYIGFPGSELFNYYRSSNYVVDAWEDVLVVRNKFFTVEDLHLLERVMSRKANPIRSMKYRFRQFLRKKIYSILFYLKLSKKKISEDPSFYSELERILNEK